MADTPLAPTPPVPEQNILEVECPNPHCPSRGKGLKIRKEMKQPIVLNSETTSLICYSHETGIYCHRCNTYYQVVITAFQAAVNWQFVPCEPPSRVVGVSKIT